MSDCWNYRAYGINIRADFDLAELPAGADATAEPDLLIETSAEARAVCERDGEAAHGRITPSSSGGYSFYRPEVGYFWIRGDSHVSVHPGDNHDLAALRLYTLGSIIGFVLHLRGYFVLHAAAVLHGGEAVLFVGESGAGKSTLAAYMAAQGYPVLTDDMIAVADRGGDRLVGYPGALSFKLWMDSIEALDLSADPEKRVANRADKYFLMNPKRAAYRAHPIKAVFDLHVAETREEQRIEACKGLEAMTIIAHSTYRPEHLRILERQDSHFKSSARIASLVPTYRLFRQWDLSSLPDVRKMIAGLLGSPEPQKQSNG